MERNKEQKRNEEIWAYNIVLSLIVRSKKDVKLAQLQYIGIYTNIELQN